MVKFSVGDGEGPSSDRRRRREATVPIVTFPPPPPVRRPRLDPDFDDNAAVERYLVDEDDEVDIDGEDDDEDELSAGGGGEGEQEQENGLVSPTSRAQSSRGGADVGPSRDGSLSVTLTDPDVLDCSVCYDPLTIPVFQCENGHTACASCCRRLQHKCPSCSLPIGYNRCRAIERVLESLRVPCPNQKFGCEEFVTYSKKQEHAQTCTYAACSCPLSGCNFSGSVKQIYQHARVKHTGPFIRFNFDSEFPVFFTISDRLLILQEEKEGVLFILRNELEGCLGNIIKVNRLGPSASKEGNYFDLGAKTEGCNLRLQSFTKNVQSRNDNPPGIFLLIPAEFFGSFGQINLTLTIWRDGQSPADIQGSCLPDRW